MKPRKLTALLLLCTLLAGCGRYGEAPPPLPPSDATPPPVSSEEPVSFPVDLYYITGGGAQYLLVPERRTITVQEGYTAAESVLFALMEEPAASTRPSSLKTAFGERLSLKYSHMEFSGDACLVYFTGSAAYEDEIIQAKASIAETMYHAFGVAYTDVFVTNAPPGKNGRPLGALLHPGTETDVRRLQEPPPSSENPDEPTMEIRDAILYYTDSQGELLVADVQTLEYPLNASIDVILSVLLNALLDGPPGGSGLAHALPAGFRYSGSAFTGLQAVETGTIDAETGEPETTHVILPARPTNVMTQMDSWGWLTLSFEGGSAAFDRALAYASIVNTVTGFLPHIVGIQIRLNGQEVFVHEVLPSSAPRPEGEGTLANVFFRADFFHLLGQSVTLYYPSADGLGLQRTYHLAPQDTFNDPLYCLQALFGEQTEASFSFSPLEPADILSVSIQGSLAVINTRSGFYEKLQALVAGLPFQGADAASLPLFSMINTLCGMKGVERVQFLEEGERIDEFLGGSQESGSIYLGNPLFENPGLILGS